jgi:hypothetical protein
MPFFIVEVCSYEGNPLEDENYSDKLVEPIFFIADSFI